MNMEKETRTDRKETIDNECGEEGLKERKEKGWIDLSTLKGLGQEKKIQAGVSQARYRYSTYRTYPYLPSAFVEPRVPRPSDYPETRPFLEADFSLECSVCSVAGKFAQRGKIWARSTGL
jgi:hypothetical protein